MIVQKRFYIDGKLSNSSNAVLKYFFQFLQVVSVPSTCFSCCCCFNSILLLCINNPTKLLTNLSVFHVGITTTCKCCVNVLIGLHETASYKAVLVLVKMKPFSHIFSKVFTRSHIFIIKLTTSYTKKQQSVFWVRQVK